MSFLTISALLVSLLIGAPLAAHLLRRKRAEERPFPPARLVPATPPTARKRSRLEDRMLFALRALAVMALAALGATPFVRCSRLALNRKSGASVALAIVIDDSLSMRAPIDGGPARSGKTRLERSVQAARELVGGLGTGDAAAIVLAGAPSRVALASTTNMTALQSALDAIEPSDRATDLDGAVHLARGLLKGLLQADKRVVLLSDLADGAPEAPPLGADGDVAIWAPLPELTAHGDDCAVARSDRAGNKVWTRIVCTRSTDAADAGASAAQPNPALAGRKLEIREGAKMIATADIPQAVGRTIEVPIDLPAGAPEVLRAVLTGEDSIAEDDSAPVASAGGALPMAVVVDTATTRVATGGPPPVEQALAALQLDAQVRPLPSVPEHAEELDAFAALVVDDPPGFTPECRRALAAWVGRGGVLLLTLGPRAGAAPLGAGFDPLVPGIVRWGPSPSPGIEAASATLLGSSAPGFAALAPHGRATLDQPALAGAEVLATWQDAAPFLTRRAVGRGAVLALTLPMSAEESDLVLRPAFLALLERFVATARARGGARRIEVGEPWTFDGYKAVTVARVSIEGPGKTKPLVVTESDGRLRAVPPLIGLYELSLDGDHTTRIAAVPEREIDLRPRRVRDDAHGAALGGMASSLDASPYVALTLLILLAAELLVRVGSSRRAADTADAS